MPPLTLNTYLILCPMLFLAAFIDSAAGGGGLISIPSYIVAGFPVHFAQGTNKFTSGASALFSSIRYFRGGKVALSPALFASAGALSGSWAGVKIALFLSNEVFQAVLLVLLPAVGVFVIFYQEKISVRQESLALPVGKRNTLSVVIGFFIGVYEGFFGAGSGTFLILAFNMILGLELLTACGSARVVNMAANMASLLIFMLNGKVFWEVALPCALFSIAGGQLGTRLAVSKGAKFIRPAMALIVALLFTKLLYEFLF
ncbi:UPF0721 transmembrane protein [Synergistales bacterium]|nr:UPF0721 transmembrane protein [Synergistales bacterium]